jgi:hypothetical protein
MAASDSRARRPAAGRGAARGAGRGRGGEANGRGRAARKRGARGAALPTVAGHPRGGQQVRQAKGWAGLLGFALVAFVSWQGDVPTEDLLIRALAGGIVAYLVVWAIAVAVWRHLVLTELDMKREQRAEEEAERRAAVQAAAAAAAAAQRAEQPAEA